MEEAKRRHGCLTVWLILVIIGTSLNALLYVLRPGYVARHIQDPPGWVTPVLIILSLFNLVCAIQLLRWKKWGFWGYCVSTVVAVAISLSLGLGISSLIGGILGIAILFGVLHIGRENKGWPQLD